MLGSFRDMRSFLLIGFFVMLFQGCGVHTPTAPKAELSPDQANTKAMVGTWTFSFPDGEPNMRVELRADGHWGWSSPAREADPNFKFRNTLQSGTWFIHDGTLYCRIEQSPFHDFFPGLAISFDVVSIQPETADFIWLNGKRQVKWTRVH